MLDLIDSEVIEFGPDPFVAFRIQRTGLKLSAGDAAEISQHIRDAIQFGVDSKSPIRTDIEQKKVTVSRHGKEITITVWSPCDHTVTTTGTLSDAKTIADRLDELVAECQRVASR